MYKDFNKIVTVMNRVYGMDLSVFDPAFLENTFERRHMISGVGDPEQYYHCLVNNCVEADVFYECIETTGKDYRFRIFATDISSEALEAGAAGEYDENAVRDVKLKYLNKYFIRQRGIYHVIPRLKQHVNFSRYDLLDQTTANHRICRRVLSENYLLLSQMKGILLQVISKNLQSLMSRKFIGYQHPPQFFKTAGGG